MSKKTCEEVVGWFRGWLGYIAFMRNVNTYKCNFKEMKMISNYIYIVHMDTQIQLWTQKSGLTWSGNLGEGGYIHYGVNGSCVSYE